MFSAGALLVRVKLDGWGGLLLREGAKSSGIPRGLTLRGAAPERTGRGPELRRSTAAERPETRFAWEEDEENRMILMGTRRALLARKRGKEIVPGGTRKSCRLSPAEYGCGILGLARAKGVKVEEEAWFLLGPRRWGGGVAEG